MSVIAGERLNFGQRDGSQIRLVVFGDEHYARYETEDGFAVVYDWQSGRFEYADLVGGRFVPAGAAASGAPPARIRRHLKESAAVVRQRRRPRGESTRSLVDSGGASEAARTLGPNAGLLEGRRLSIGSVRGLTILVQFQDVSSSVTQADVDQLLNAQNYTRNGNVCSAREYFQRVSSGKLDYTNDVVGPFRLSRRREYYAQNLMIREAVELAVAAGVDLRRYDSKREGIVDALNVLYAGQTQYLDELWPHNASIRLDYGPVRTDLYLLTSMGSSASQLSIGTFCHENGHLLCRFPDMYDYGDRDGDSRESGGIGYYCLMGAGNHLDNGRTPAPVSGYLRELAGWCDHVVLLDGDDRYDARHGAYDTVLKYPTERPNEYFIVENRSKTGLDAHLPASGLAVYHCDTLGSNEWQEGTAGRHYQCALMQADGRRDLERNVNQGDGTDLFGKVDGIALSHATSPSSRKWDGSDSGLLIRKVDAPGDVIRFHVGPEVDPGLVLRLEASPDAAIPDNSPAGVASALRIDSPGVVKSIRTGVSISHTWIGDLVIELESPAGKLATLHDRKGGAQQNLNATYDSDGTPGLAAMAGDRSDGTWQLRVRDVEARDNGTLHRWTLEVALEGVSGPVQGETRPALAIPDNNSAGIASVIPLVHGGLCGRLELEVEITHSWIGDLRIALVAPSGRSAVVHGRVGGGQRNLRVAYDSHTPGSPLTSLAGQAISGNWTLRVTDLEARDAGTLDRWSLRVTPSA